LSYKEIYVLLLALLDGVEPDIFNLIGGNFCRVIRNGKEKDKIISILLKEIE